MDYKRIYDSLIQRAVDRKIEGPVERHHIIPKCMGGSNKSSNIVSLTPEEHYVAHQLLVKIYPEEKGLIYAMCMMTGNPSGHRNNKMYGWIRRLNGRQRSETTKALWQDPEFRQKRIAQIQQTASDPKWREVISKAQMGRKKSEQERENIRQARFTAQKRTYSEEAKSRMVLAQQKRRANETVRVRRMWFNNGEMEKLCTAQPNGWNKGRLKGL